MCRIGPDGFEQRRMRAAGGGATMGDSMHKREENSVRVTNLSEDTREDDLRVRHLQNLVQITLVSSLQYW